VVDEVVVEVGEVVGIMDLVVVGEVVVGVGEPVDTDVLSLTVK